MNELNGLDFLLLALILLVFMATVGSIISLVL